MCGGTTNTTNTTTQQSMSPQMQQSYQDLMSSAKNQAATPYQTYDGPRVAPLDQQQQQAADTAQAMQGNYEGDLNSARTYTGLGATNVAGNFYSPQTYNTQAVNPSTVSPGTAGLYQAGLAQGTAPANIYAQQVGNVPQVQAQQIAAQQVQAQQVQNLPQVNAQQIDPSRLPQVQAQNTSTGQFGRDQFSQYGNPYQQAVINATMGQLGYQQQQNLNQADSRAAQSGAFGGDRSGIEQAQIYRDNSQVQAQALAGLNTANWAQAQQQFNADQGRGLQSQIANQGANLQAGLANQGTNLSALQSNQGTNLQGQLANQGTNLAAQQTNVGANLQGQLANQGSSLQASLANQSTGLQGQEFNANTNFQGQLANQGANLQAGLANQGWQGNYGLANMAAANQQQQFNAGQGNQMGQFNTGLNLQGQLANQSAGLQGQMFNSTQAMQAQQLNDQSKQYYANLAQNDRNRQLAAGSQYMGITGQEQQAKLNDIGALMQTGAMSQQQQQQNYNTAYNDFVQQRQYPFQTIGWQSDIYHGIPAPMSTTGSSQTPGPNLASAALGAVGTGIGAYMAYGADGGMVGPGGFQSGDDSGMASGYAPGGQVQTDIYGMPLNPAQMGGTLPVQTPARTGFWDAGPSGVSPAMSIFGAIGRQQGPQFLSNVAAGAGEGMQDIGKQRLQGAQMADLQSQAAQRNMVAQQAAALANARSGLMQRIQERKGGMGPGGAAPSPSMPGGSAPAPGLPGGPGQAGAGPVPGSPAPGVPTSPGAPPTPPGPVSPQPIPSQQPAGQPMGSGAMGVPTAPGQQMAAPAAPGGPGPVDQQRPGLPAETIMQAPSLATAPSTTAAQHSAPQQGADLSNMPLLQNDLATVSAWDGNPLTADLIKPSAERLMEVAKTGKTFDASGNETFAPGHLANLAMQTYTEADAKGRGELPSKMRFMQAEQGAIGAREKGVIAFKSPYDIKLAGATAAFHGAQERQTQTHGASLDMIHPTVPEIGQDGKPTGNFVEQNMTRLQGVMASNKGDPAQMSGFGGPPSGGVPAGAPEPPPQVSGATSAASAAPALPEASSTPPAAPQQAPAAKVYPGFTGQPVQTPQQRATGEDLGKHAVAQYEGDVTHLTENQDQLQKANMAIQALTQLQTGKWANFQNDIGQHLQAIGIDPTKFDLNNPADYQVLESQAIEGTFKMVHALTSRAALQEVKMGREATYDPAKAPGANVKFLADLVSGLNWENKLYGDRIQNFQATQGAQQFDINSWIKNNPLPAEYQQALAQMPRLKGEEAGSRGPNIETPGTAKQAPARIPTAQEIQGIPPAQIPAYKSNLAKMDVQKMSPQERAQWLEAVHALKGIGQ